MTRGRCAAPGLLPVAAKAMEGCGSAPQTDGIWPVLGLLASPCGTRWRVVCGSQGAQRATATGPGSAFPP